MKLLLENWKKYLLSEGMKTIIDLPPKTIVAIYEEGDTTTIELADEETKKQTLGYVMLIKVEDDCNVKNLWEIHSKAEGGWGPFLYDLAIEWATYYGRGAVSSRNNSSEDAQRVWQFYFTKRQDVEKFPLDDLRNTRTPQEEDNCVQDQNRYYLNSQLSTSASKEERLKHLESSPFAYYYRKTPKLINLLFQRDLLYDGVKEQKYLTYLKIKNPG